MRPYRHSELVGRVLWLLQRRFELILILCVHEAIWTLFTLFTISYSTGSLSTTRFWSAFHQLNVQKRSESSVLALFQSVLGGAVHSYIKTISYIVI